MVGHGCVYKKKRWITDYTPLPHPFLFPLCELLGLFFFFSPFYLLFHAACPLFFCYVSFHLIPKLWRIIIIIIIIISFVSSLDHLILLYPPPASLISPRPPISANLILTLLLPISPTSPPPPCPLQWTSSLVQSLTRLVCKLHIPGNHERGQIRLLRRRLFFRRR